MTLNTNEIALGFRIRGKIRKVNCCTLPQANNPNTVETVMSRRPKKNKMVTQARY